MLKFSMRETEGHLVEEVIDLEIVFYYLILSLCSSGKFFLFFFSSPFHIFITLSIPHFTLITNNTHPAIPLPPTYLPTISSYLHPSPPPQGSHQTTIVNTTIVSPSGIAVDSLARKLYWTNDAATLDAIEVSELDGTNRLILFFDGIEKPRDIVVHSTAGSVVVFLWVWLLVSKTDVMN